MGATIVSQIIWFGCSLTTLEHLLRRKADPSRGNYSGSFTETALRKFLGVKVSSWFVLAFLAAAVVISTIVVLN